VTQIVDRVLEPLRAEWQQWASVDRPRNRASLQIKQPADLRLILFDALIGLAIIPKVYHASDCKGLTLFSAQVGIRHVRILAAWPSTKLSPK